MLATRTLCRCTLSTSKTACSTTSGRCCGSSLSCVRHAHSTRLHTHHTQNNMLYRQRTMLCENSLSVVCRPRELCDLDTFTNGKKTCSPTSGRCSLRAACWLCVYHANSALLHAHHTQNNMLYRQRTMLCLSSSSVVCLPRELCAAGHTHQQSNLLHTQRTMLCESSSSFVCLPRELFAAAHSQ